MRYNFTKDLVFWTNAFIVVFRLFIIYRQFLIVSPKERERRRREREREREGKMLLKCIYIYIKKLTYLSAVLADDTCPSNLFKVASFVVVVTCTSAASLTYSVKCSCIFCKSGLSVSVYSARVILK
jgi:hypothetical protein